MQKAFSKFMKTGKIEDYLNYKKEKQKSMEVAKELSLGEKNEVKRRDSHK